MIFDFLLHIVCRDFKKDLLIILRFICFFLGHGSGKRIKILEKVYFFIYLKILENLNL